MSQIQPAGGRLLQSLQSHASHSTQNLFAGSSVMPTAPQPVVTDSVPPAPPSNNLIASATTVTADTTPSLTPEQQEAQRKMEIFDQVLAEIEQGGSEPAASPQQTIASALDPDAVYQPSEDSGLFAQAIPAAVDQAQEEWQQQQVPQIGGRQKEHFEGGMIAAPEVPADIQYVETEKSPEIPPEVESFIQHVEETAQTQPQEIVVATDVVPSTPAMPVPPRIVKVLPITKAQEEVGLRKSTSFSLRWLVEYGHKLAKALVGQVVYRES